MILVRTRQAIAALLLVGAAGVLAWSSFASWRNSPEISSLAWLHPSVSSSALAVFLLVAAVGVICSAWWGRLVSFAWAWVAGTFGLLALLELRAEAAIPLGYATLLVACLTGATMFARFEGAPTARVRWGQPGMTLERAALVTNLAALMAAALILPGTFLRWTTMCIIVALPTPETFPLMIGFFLLVTLMSGGLVLLARQKTMGLLLVALAAPGMLLMLVLRMRFAQLPFFLPGLVCGWAVFLRYLPRMVRFLRT